MKKKIGIMGGSFDPVHSGHIGLAEDALREAGLDCVILIPTAVQPFKQDAKAADGNHRLNMLKLAAENNERFIVSDYELCNKGISYTYLTMRAMQQEADNACPDGADLYFITGTDSFLKIDTWMNGEELLTNYGYIVGTRPGYRQDELEEFMDFVREEYGTYVINLSRVQFDVSSTEIRERIKSGLSISNFVPPAVERYIKENELYI